MSYETTDAFECHFTEIGKEAPPRHLGTRYDVEGRFLPEPGNTIVCHVVAGSATAAALLAARDALKALPHGDRFTCTPPSSYHMTVFQGTIEGRRGPDYWPAGLSADMPIDDTTEWFAARLRGLPPAPSFRMRPVQMTPLGLVVAGATDADEKAIRGWRDRLTALFDYRHPDHDEYVFHVTLAYQTAWLPADAGAAYRPALAEITRRIVEAAPTLELGPPEFCVFDDMKEFRPLIALG
ncbi:DUF1868 domain-containing protein [Nitratireductor mangrovi]|uniref:DUF1868 domain-containing protein n=1 Tax=Nitratireductor mangrovi TaxID=2599600 RepID=A0A5B8KY99_9HYPH|nr:DUF1868 domain-containing protein [Nitratireductor mangrovi]QDZ00697.1 DUF1868 domain-containing protein [Nitratireductor mangrovi]